MRMCFNNGGAYNISYNSSSCNLLNSSTVSNDLKCLMLCQMTICKSLIFDGTTNTCTLNGSQPGLIEYDNLTNLLFLSFAPSSASRIVILIHFCYSNKFEKSVFKLAYKYF